MFNVVKRDGSIKEYDHKFIMNAILRAQIDGHGLNGPMSRLDALSIINAVEDELKKQATDPSAPVTVERIQDAVERALMHSDFTEVAKAYILYREEQNARRESEGNKNVLATVKLIKALSRGLQINPAKLINNMSIPDGEAMAAPALTSKLLLSALDVIETSHDYDLLAGRLVMFDAYDNARKSLSENHGDREWSLSNIVRTLGEAGMYDMSLWEVNEEGEYTALTYVVPERDFKLTYLAAKTLVDRYMVKDRFGVPLETPQLMFLRMSLALSTHGTVELCDTYNALSTFEYFHSTPSMFNGGLTHPQMASCYLSTLPKDSLKGIFDLLDDNGQLSKWAGGLGMNWTDCRASGSLIRGTNGESNGVVPFLKIAESVVIAVDQGSKRRGSAAIYLESWHADIWSFLQLRAEGGEEARRTHGLETANWIPDLLMERVRARGKWSLFSPDEVEDLSLLTGNAFEEAYVKLEEAGKAGELRVYEEVNAYTLFKEMLSQLFETGAGWITFKDPSMERYQGDKRKKVRSSNLCFSGDTMVSVADGRNAVDMKELAEAGLGFPVYSGVKRVGRPGHKVVIREATAFKTGVKEVGKVTLSDGSSFNCTPDHELFTMSGDKVEAQHSIGVELSSIFTYTNGNRKSPYRHINSLTDANVKQHIMIHEHYNGPRAKGEHIDHIVNGKGDKITNLQRLSKEEHWAKTAEERKGSANPVHKVNNEYITKVRRNQMAGVGNNTYSGISNLELIGMARDVMSEHGLTVMTRAVYKEFLVPQGAPKSFSKFRFGGSFATYLDHVHGVSEYVPVLPEVEEVKREDYYDDTCAIAEEYKARFYDGHKRNGLTVLSFEIIGVEDVYCLNVPGTHNFYILTDGKDAEYANSSGVLVSNCTEILLPADEEETAVCTLASIVLGQHFKAGTLELDYDSIARTVRMMVRALDATMEYNFYPTERSRRSNLRHRPLGIGMAGIQDAMSKMGIAYDSEEAVDFNHRITEFISFHAISESIVLASELGPFENYIFSKWADGILPIDTYATLNARRPLTEYDRFSTTTMDWDSLRIELRRHGIRNSCLMAIAPTATSANIANDSASIEPTYENIYVKGNLSGSFTAVNPVLRDQLVELGLWNDKLINAVIENNGSIQNLANIPDHIKALHKTAFEIEPIWLIKCAAARGVWIDQSQSLNLYVKNPTGAKLYGVYMTCWEYGVKTTYYLRSAAAEIVNADDALEVNLPQVEIISAPSMCTLNSDGCAVCE